MPITTHPKWKYHRTLAPVIVRDQEAEDELGAGWVDTPAALDAPVASPVDPPAPAKPKAPKAKELRA